MKDTVKDLIDDMIGKPISKMTTLKEVFEKMGISEANEVTKELLFWQKLVHGSLRLPFKHLTKDKLLLSEKFMLLDRANALFEHSPPVLSEVFTLEGNEISLNSMLTEEEVTEIRAYIDEHYRVSIHIKPGGFSSF